MSGKRPAYLPTVTILADQPSKSELQIEAGEREEFMLEIKMRDDPVPAQASADLPGRLVGHVRVQELLRTRSATRTSTGSEQRLPTHCRQS